MKELTIDALVENLEKVNAFVQESVGSLDCSPKSLIQLDVVVEEIFVNVADYAYPEKNGSVTIHIETEKKPPKIKMVFIDGGLKYNPLKNEDPDITLPPEERPVGGLGIFIVKNMVDDIFYEYADGKNILTFVKTLA